MTARLIKLITLAIFMFLLIFPASAQDETTTPTAPSDQQLGVFKLEPQRFGGAMAENGSWAVTTGITIVDQVDGTQNLTANGSFEMQSPGLAYHVSEKVIKGIFVLLIGERIFDGNGDYKYGQNVLSSGFLTETGLPVEGVTHGLLTDTFGGNTKHPVNKMILLTPDELKIENGELIKGDFAINVPLDAQVPSGYYRFGVLVGIQLDDTHFVTVKNENPSQEEFNVTTGSLMVTGLAPVGKPAQPHLPWVILSDVVPGGGVIPKLESDNFGVTKRIGFSPRAILPPVDPRGGQIRYNLEPSLPYLKTEAGSPLSLELAKGEISISIKSPQGHIVDLGSLPVTEWKDSKLSTGQDRFNFSFSEYGLHQIEIKGYLVDKYGMKIYGGGTYEIYVAVPLDIRPVLKPGMPVKPGESLDMALRVIPPVPAKITVEGTFNPWSLNRKVERDKFEINCDRWGIYTPPKSDPKKRWTTTELIRFSKSGEYRLDLIADYRNDRGVLYMGSYNLAGIVDSENKIELRGEDPSSRKTYPEESQVFTAPPKSNELLTFAPDAKLLLDPDLRLVLTDSLRDQRVLMGEKTYDLPDGATGVLPRSTSGNLPAHYYPDMVDRRAYSYIAGSTLDGQTVFVIKDGGPMVDELGNQNCLLSLGDGDFLQLFSSMVFRDYPLDKVYYGSMSSGAFVVKDATGPAIVTVKDGAVENFGKKTPFLHSFSFFPGAIIPKEKVFAPRYYVFPPVPGITKINLTYPNGEKTFLTSIVDERGFSSKMLEELPELWQEGVYRVKYSFFPNVVDGNSIEASDSGVNDVEFEFYVLGDSNGNVFKWNIPSGTEVASNQALSLISLLPENAFTEGKLNYCMSYNGNLIEEKSIDFKGNGFDLSINIPGIIESLVNFDPKNPRDVLEIGCFVKGVNQKGKNNYMANRIVIRGGRLEY